MTDSLTRGCWRASLLLAGVVMGLYAVYLVVVAWGQGWTP